MTLFCASSCVDLAVLQFWFVSACRSVILLVLGVGVHAVSLMTPDVMCHHASDYSPTSQSRHSDSFKNDSIRSVWWNSLRTFIHTHRIAFSFQRWAPVKAQMMTFYNLNPAQWQADHQSLWTFSVFSAGPDILLCLSGVCIDEYINYLIKTHSKTQSRTKFNSQKFPKGSNSFLRCHGSKTIM